MRAALFSLWLLVASATLGASSFAVAAAPVTEETTAEPAPAPTLTDEQYQPVLYGLSIIVFFVALAAGHIVGEF